MPAFRSAASPEPAGRRNLRSRAARPISLLLPGVLALLTAGCDSPLFERAQHPYVYAGCFLVLAVLDLLAILEILGSSRSVLLKLVWIGAVLFLPLLGLAGYLLFGRK